MILIFLVTHKYVDNTINRNKYKNKAKKGILNIM